MKSVGRLFFVFYATVLLSPALWAQISPAGMSFVDTNNPEFDSQWIEISDGNEIAATGGDDEFHSVNFGFSFRFYSQTYSTVYVSTNGYLTFNNYGAVDPYTINDNLTTGVPPDRMLAVYWDDLILDENSARIYYKVIGTFPYRKLIVEYKDVKIKGGISLITFQVILHETTNLIQYHYLDLAGEQGAAATVGLKFDPDRLVYSFNNPSLSDDLGILFVPYSTLSAVSSISPTQAVVGTNGQQFRLAINTLTTGATQLQHMGKADLVRVFNPLPDPISTVESIRVRGIEYFFIQRNTPPTPAEYNTLPTIATWYYDDGIDSLFIQLPPYVARDSVSVAFRVNLPTTPGGHNFNARTHPRSNFVNGAATSSAITLVAGAVHHYTIAPQTASITIGGPLGASIQFTVMAFDEFNNLVVNNGSATNSVLGSATAVVTPPTSNFNNNSSYNFVVQDTKAGTFSARAVNTVNSNLRAQTGIITVNAGVAANIAKVSGDSTGVIAGANQILKVLVTDAAGNPKNAEQVEFSVLQGGGNFGGLTVRTVSTGSDGIAQVTYTTGSLVGLNQIDASLVSSPGVSLLTPFSVTTVPGSISYYTVTPATFNPTVGNDVSVAVAAFDANNNAATNNSTTVVEFFSDDGTGLTFTPNSAILVSGVTSFMVNDTIAETFRVRARSQGQPSITGFSNPITTTAGAPDALAKISGDNQTGPINSTLPLDLQVEVNDQYGNPVGGTTVTFDPIGGGTALNPNAVTNSAGIASSGWTVHSTATPDTMAAYIAGVDTVIFTATVVAGSGVTMTQLTPFTSSGVVDNFVADNFRVRITDGGNNPVPNFPVSFAIVAKPAGAANDSLTVYSATTNAQGEVGTLLHLGTRVGTYRVRAYSSSTAPNFVDFTATATNGAADRILIASGNNQGGTVGQPLTNPVVFQLVDPYDNPVAGSTLNFTPLPLNGTANPVSAPTNASGQASTSWTLGQTVGAQKMVATLNAITSDTAYADAGPAGGASLAPVSMNQITSDSIAALPGEDVTVIVEARDAFGNLAPNTTVNFEALPGFNAIFQDPQVTTDAQGRAVNIVTTDTGNDSTFFRAYITGLDTLDLHIFHIRYAGGLTPQAVSPGDIPTFSLNLENLSPHAVSLNQGATQFRFSDGANLFSATLSGPLTLPPGITNVSFVPALLDTNFTSGNYAPEVFLRGSGANALMGGSVKLPANSLTIFTVSITRITGSKSAVTGGDTVTIIMRVRKAGPVTVTVNDVGLDIAGSPPIPQSNITPSPGNPTVLPPSPGVSTHLFEFVVNVPGNASGDYIVDGQFQGTTLSGFPANDFSADTTFTFAASVSANLSLQSLDPDTVTTGQAVTYTARLYNDGAFDVLLNPSRTYLAFGSDTVFLKQSYSVPAGGIANAVEVEFIAPAILSPAQAPPYPLNLRLYGTENGIAFDTTIVNASTMLVQEPPNVTVALINALADTVAQNTDSVRTIVQLTNANPLSAPAVISLPAGVRLSTSVLNNIQPTGSGNIILAGGTTSSPIEFIYPIALNYPPGTDRVKVSYDYTDFNSTTPYSAAPADSDTFVVLSRAQLSLLGHTLSPKHVSTGQTGVNFRFTVQNIGQSPASIDNGDVSILFNNNHTITLTSPPTLPAVLPGGSSQEFIYNIDIDPNAAIGLDPLDLTVSHADTFSGKRYTDVVENNLDTLIITSVDLALQALDPTTVTSGDPAVFTAAVSNSGAFPVIIDPKFSYLQFGSDTVYLKQSYSVPAGGNAVEVEFLTDSILSPTQALRYPLDLRLFGTENGIEFDTTLANADSIMVQNRPTVIVASIDALQDTVVQNQDSLRTLVRLTNSGAMNAPALISLPGGVKLSTLALNNISPTGSGLLTLAAGDTSPPIEFIYSLGENYPPGTDRVMVSYNYSDANSGTVYPAAPADSDSFVVLSRARLSLQTHSLSPDTVSPGQTGVVFSFEVRNDGESPAAIGNGDIIIQFTNNHLIALTSPPPGSLPVVVPGGSIQQFVYNIDVSSNSNIGLDPLDLTVRHTDTLSGKMYQDIVEDNLDTLRIIQGTTPAEVQIQTVKLNPAVANQGQSGLQAKVRLKNLGENPVRIDSMQLIYSRPGISDSLLTPLPAQGEIAPGDTVSFEFTLSVADTMAIGSVGIDAGYDATDLLFLTTFSDSGAVAPGTLSVLKPANFTFTPLTLVPDTASQGQTGIIASTVMTNGDAATSPARVDSFQTLFSVGGDTVTAQLINPLTVPLVLPGGESVQVQYRLTVASTANPGTIDVRVAANARDLTDTTRIFADTSQTAVLTVQQRASLQIVALEIQPDSAYLGQNQIPVNITVQNTGGGLAQLNTVSLTLHNAPNFPKSLLTFDLPVVLSLGQQKEVNYQISVPSNINLPNGDSLIYAGAALQGVELSSGTALVAAADSLDSLLIAEPPFVEFVGIPDTIPTVYNLGDTARFVLEVVNTGGTPLTLNPNTFVRLENTAIPSQFFTRPIDLLATNPNILPGDTTQLVFRDTVVANAGDFRFSLGVRGNVYQAPNQIAYSQDILTNVFLNVGGTISIQLVQIIPDVVQPGDTSIFINAIVEKNTALPVTIDPGWTVEFSYNDGEPLPITATRIDTLTMIGATATRDTLRWKFDVPSSAHTGEANAEVTLTFNNGAITPAPRAGFFDIQSGAKVRYVANSLAPNTVVPGQKVAFTARFINSGSENFLVNAAGSFLEFSDGQDTLKTSVNGNFVVRGAASGQQPDTSEVAFHLDSLSSQFIPGNYAAAFHLFGELPNSDTLTAVDTVVSAQVSVVPEALVSVDSIDVIPTSIIRGQGGIEVRYLIHNSGASAATVQSANSIFSDSLGADISALWSLQNQTPSFPFTLNASDSTVLTRNFVVSQNITPGPVRARLSVNYNDIRKPDVPRVADDPAVYDSVNVIVPSRIFVNTLELEGVPNAANQTVNFNQSYNLRLALQNSGQDSVRNIMVRFFDDADGSIILTETISDTILPPDSSYQKVYPFTAGSISDTIRYRAVILEAISVTSGTPVSIGEPLDNREDVFIQMPTQLELLVEASGDSAYSQGQDFTVSFSITPTGQSPFGNGSVQIELPPDYNLGSPSAQLPIGPSNLSGSWQVTASPDTTLGAFDSIRVSYLNIPLDLNTTATVALANDSVIVPVRVVEGGSVKVTSITIPEPLGAVDSTLSSGQQFRLSAVVVYSGSVDTTGRTARVKLPPGFIIDPDSVEKTIQNSTATVSWDITISQTILQTFENAFSGGSNGNGLNMASRGDRNNPERGGSKALSTGGLERLLSEVFQLQVTASGIDGGDPNSTFSNTRSKEVTVVERAHLVMNSEVVAPAGATLGTVSTYQPFDMKIWVENLGEAGVIPADSNYVTVIVPQGFTIEGLAAGDSLTNHPLKTGLAEADTIRIFAPPTVPLTQPLVRVRLDSAARDENSNLPANIQQALSSFNLAVEDRVSLRIDNLTAGGDSLLQNQDFTLQGLVTNTGDANVEPNRMVTVKLSFDTTAFILINPQDTVKTVQLVNKQGVISWQMQTKPDATIGNDHIITASIDSTLSWDENDFPARGAHLEKGTATDTLSILGSGAFSISQAYLNTPGTDSLTVSTFQAVQVVVIPQISGLFVNRTATLYLPDIFPTDSITANIPAGGNPVVFNIQIPDTASGVWEQLQVKIRAASQINPNFIVSDSAYLHIFVEKRASMAMRSSVIAPAGATLGTVSTYQPFDVQLWVENLGQAGVIPTDSNHVTVIVPQGFSIEGLAAGDSLTNYPLKTGLAEADTIRIFAPPTVPATQPLVRVRLDSAARDENTNLPANVQQALSSFNLAVESRVSLRIDNLTAGADSLVQDQQFTLQGLVTNTGDANVEPNRMVTVKLSFDTTAFSLIIPDDTVKSVQLVNKQSIISWQMRTKPDAAFGNNHIITASIDSTLSWDENEDSTMAVYLEKGTASDTLSILDTGTFAIASAYLNTPGTDSLTVSTNQAVKVVVKPQFTAGLFTNRFAILDLPYFSPPDTMVTPISGDSVTFNIMIPDTTGSWDLRVRIRGTSQINPNVVVSDTAYLHLDIEKRTTLVLSGQVIGSGPNNTVSQGQTFKYRATVANVGQAGVLASPQGELTISVGNGLEANPDSLVKSFDVGVPLSWTIEALPNAQVAGLVGKIKSIQDEKARLIVAAQRSAAPEGQQGNTRLAAAGQQPEIPEERQLSAKANRAANSPENAGSLGQSREMEILNDQLSGLYKELSAIVDTSYLKVTISRRPLDENSGQPAAVEVGTDSVTISIAEKPEIDILTSTVAPTWSTEQSGIVEVTVEAPENVIERSGTLRLPEGFSFINPADSLKSFGQGSTVSWGIRADATISQPILSANMTVIVKGRDQNSPPPNTVVVSDTTLLPVTVQRKALLTLSSQSTSIRLLRGETFTVQATVANQGVAAISGTGRVRLNIGSEGFAFASGETAEKEFSGNNTTLQWNVVAPDFDINTVFGIGFTQLPVDFNTQSTASVGIDTLVIDVNMVSRRITVKQLDNIESENSYAQGDNEVPVVGVSFTNPNSVEDIFLKGFTISILEGDGETPVSDMQNLLSRVEVVSYDYYQGSLAKINSPPDRLGELTIDSQTSNPFTVNFANVDTLRGLTTDSLVLWVDLANQPVNRNFRVQLRGADAEGAFVGKVDVVDSLGTPLEALNLWSPSITILSTDPEETFRNYPNPFSMETQLPGAPKGATRFSFYMDNSGDVELRIYTLMGQLVWSTEVTNLPDGLHGSVLSWDGRNGQGNRVVNGVYVAVLKVNYSSGGSETYQTKVAYIK